MICRVWFCYLSTLGRSANKESASQVRFCFQSAELGTFWNWLSSVSSTSDCFRFVFLKKTLHLIRKLLAGWRTNNYKSLLRHIFFFFFLLLLCCILLTGVAYINTNNVGADSMWLCSGFAIMFHKFHKEWICPCCAKSYGNCAHDCSYSQSPNFQDQDISSLDSCLFTDTASLNCLRYGCICVIVLYPKTSCLTLHHYNVCLRPIVKRLLYLQIFFPKYLFMFCLASSFKLKTAICFLFLQCGL